MQFQAPVLPWVEVTQDRIIVGAMFCIILHVSMYMYLHRSSFNFELNCTSESKTKRTSQINNLKKNTVHDYRGRGLFNEQVVKQVLECKSFKYVDIAFWQMYIYKLLWGLLLCVVFIDWTLQCLSTLVTRFEPPASSVALPRPLTPSVTARRRLTRCASGSSLTSLCRSVAYLPSLNNECYDTA
jgi:hypothetical protein